MISRCLSFPLLNQSNLCNICDVTRFAPTAKLVRGESLEIRRLECPFCTRHLFYNNHFYPCLQNVSALANKVSAGGWVRAFVPQCGMLRSPAHTAGRVSWPVSNPTVKPRESVSVSPPPYGSLAFDLFLPGSAKGKMCTAHVN